MVEQENNNHRDYENTVTDNEDEDRIDRFHYELTSSEQQEEENGGGDNQNENNNEYSCVTPIMVW